MSFSPVSARRTRAQCPSSSGSPATGCNCFELALQPSSSQSKVVLMTICLLCGTPSACHSPVLLDTCQTAAATEHIKQVQFYRIKGLSEPCISLRVRVGELGATSLSIDTSRSCFSCTLKQEECLCPQKGKGCCMHFPPFRCDTIQPGAGSLSRFHRGAQKQGLSRRLAWSNVLADLASFSIASLLKS